MDYFKGNRGASDPYIWELTWPRLAELCRRSDFVLVKDPQALLQLPTIYSLPDGSRSHRVVLCEGNLAFRLRYEPLRHAEGRLIVHQVTEDVFIPDVEERAARSRGILQISLQWLVGEALGIDDVPSELDSYAEFLRGCIPDLIRFYRQYVEEVGEGPPSSDMRRIVLSAYLNAKLWGAVSPAGLWRFWFQERERVLALSQAGLSTEFLRLLNQAPGALAALPEFPAQEVRDAVWLSAILSQHLQGGSGTWLALRERLQFPFALPLSGSEALVQSVWDEFPELARRQTGELELKRLPEVLPLVREEIGLGDGERALEMVRRERYSALLAALALWQGLASLPGRTESPGALALGHLAEELEAAWCGQDLPYGLCHLVRIMRLSTSLLNTFEQVEEVLGSLGPLAPMEVFSSLVGITVERGVWRLTSQVEGVEVAIQGAVNGARGFLRRGILVHQAELREVGGWLASAAERVQAGLEEAFVSAYRRHYEAWVEGGAVARPETVLEELRAEARQRGEEKLRLLVLPHLTWTGWEEVVAPLVVGDHQIEARAYIRPHFMAPGERPLAEGECLAQLLRERGEGICRQQLQGGSRLCGEGFEIVVGEHWSEEILQRDTPSAQAIVELTNILREWGEEGGFYIWGGALLPHSATASVPLADLIVPLVLVHASGEGETGLWVGRLTLQEEYGEGKPGKLSFPLRYGGGERVCLVEVDLAGLGEVEPVEVVARAQVEAIEIEFTPVARHLSKCERERGVVEREIWLAVRVPGEGKTSYRRRGTTLRLRLQPDRVVRRESPALDGILGVTGGRPRRKS